MMNNLNDDNKRRDIETSTIIFRLMDKFDNYSKDIYDLKDTLEDLENSFKSTSNNLIDTHKGNHLLLSEIEKTLKEIKNYNDKQVAATNKELAMVENKTKITLALISALASFITILIPVIVNTIKTPTIDLPKKEQ